MYRKLMWIFMFWVLLIPFKGRAQNVWTLDACIAYALEHNLEQDTQNYNAKISKEQWRQSKRDMLPTFSVSYPSYTVSFGRTLDAVTNNYVDTRFVSGLSGGVYSSLTLFESFKKWHTLSYQKLLYESSKFDTQQAQYNLAFRIMDLFNNILFQQGTLEIIKEQQATNLLHQKTIAKKVALGLVAKADFYEIEAASSADALEVLKANNALTAAKLALIQAMNLDETDIDIVQDMEMITTLDRKKPLDIEAVFRASKAILPSLQKSKINVETTQKYLAIKKTGRLPRLSLSGGISTRFSDNIKDDSGRTTPFREQIGNNQSQYIGLSLNYPIFGNGSTRSGIKIAKIQVERAQTQLKIEEQSTYKIIQEVLQKSEALTAEEALNLKKAKAKEKAYHIAKKKYEKGLINLYELQMASNTYLLTKIDQVRLMAQIAIQKRTLDFYNGTFILPVLTPSN